LYNRRYMEESLYRELRRAGRRHSSVGVLMIDVDHFKRFNDTHGHQAGDAMLRAVATILQKGVRAEDVVCRYGGEELTIILLDAALEDTRARAEHLCQAVRGVEVSHRGQS